jgi:hypothetical protein
MFLTPSFDLHSRVEMLPTPGYDWTQNDSARKSVPRVPEGDFTNEISRFDFLFYIYTF